MSSQPVKTQPSSAMIVVIILVTVFGILLSVAASVAIALSIVYLIRRVPSVPPKPADTQSERRPAQ